MKEYIIGTFNPRNLSLNKLKNELYNELVLNILSRYDICFIPEVRNTGSKNPLLDKIVIQLNINYKSKYKYVVGFKTKENSKEHDEKYAFVYKADKFILEETIVITHPKLTRFFYAIRFVLVDKPMIKVILLGAHIKPKKGITLYEINLLMKKQKELKHKWDLSIGILSRITRFIICVPNSEFIGPIIVGDINFSREFIGKNYKEFLIQYPKFVDLLEDVDTTLSDNNNNSYDKIIVPIKHLKYFPKKGTAFRFNEQIPKFSSIKVTEFDHYPISVSLFV